MVFRKRISEIDRAHLALIAPYAGIGSRLAPSRPNGTYIDERGENDRGS